MAFALDPDRPFDAAVRRLAISQLEGVIHVLKKQPDGVHEAIHDARKKFKRLRGLYRLIRPAAKEFAQAENTRIRDIALTLSADRDATAMIECARYLRLNVADARTDMALAHLEMALVRQRDTTILSHEALQDRVKAAIGACREAIAAVERQHFACAKPDKVIARAWRKRLSSAHAALMTVRAEESAGNFHELRKKSQTYWFFCALVASAWPSALKAKRTDAKTLAGLLGHEHDLSVMIALLDGPDAPGLDEAVRAACLDEALKQRAKLRKRSVKLARTVFHDEAEIEAAIVGTLWRQRAGR